MPNHNQKNESDLLFEEYLNANGHAGHFTYEPPIAGKSKCPDYALKWQDQELLFEVKEIRQTSRFKTGQSTFIDPYKPVRDKIHAAGKQFSEFDSECCALVIFNQCSGRTFLHPHVVFGAMVGDAGFVMDFDERQGQLKPETTRSCFLPHRGKMVRSYVREEYQNTRISAIIVIERLRERTVEFHRLCHKAVVQKQHELGRPMEPEERAILAVELLMAHPGMVVDAPRVRVFENPFTPRNRRLPRELFRGAYDERWSVASEQADRVFVGSELAAIEKAKARYGPEDVEAGVGGEPSGEPCRDGHP